MFVRRFRVRAGATRAQAIDRAAAANRQQPRCHRSALRFISGRLSPHLRKHVLDDVFGLGLIADDVKSK
jgi:hypothetical protein